MDDVMDYEMHTHPALPMQHPPVPPQPYTQSRCPYAQSTPSLNAFQGRMPHQNLPYPNLHRPYLSHGPPPPYRGPYHQPPFHTPNRPILASPPPLGQSSVPRLPPAAPDVPERNGSSQAPAQAAGAVASAPLSVNPSGSQPPGLMPMTSPSYLAPFTFREPLPSQESPSNDGRASRSTASSETSPAHPAQAAEMAYAAQGTRSGPQTPQALSPVASEASPPSQPGSPNESSPQRTGQVAAALTPPTPTEAAPTGTTTPTDNRTARFQGNGSSGQQGLIWSSRPRLVTPADRRRALRVQRHRRSASSSNSPPSSTSGSEDDIDSEIVIIRAGSTLEGFYPGSSTEDRIRAQQVLRGSIVQRSVASKSAIASLESVDIDSLEDSEKMCIICYNDFGKPSPEGVNESPLRLPKCKHIFGDHCIKKWFAESDSCPYCRDKVPSDRQLRTTAHAISQYAQAHQQPPRREPAVLPPPLHPASSNTNGSNQHGRRSLADADQENFRRNTRRRHSAFRSSMPIRNDQTSPFANTNSPQVQAQTHTQLPQLQSIQMPMHHPIPPPYSSNPQTMFYPSMPFMHQIPSFQSQPEMQTSQAQATSPASQAQQVQQASEVPRPPQGPQAPPHFDPLTSFYNGTTFYLPGQPPRPTRYDTPNGYWQPSINGVGANGSCPQVLPPPLPTDNRHVFHGHFGYVAQGQPPVLSPPAYFHQYASSTSGTRSTLGTRSTSPSPSPALNAGTPQIPSLLEQMSALVGSANMGSISPRRIGSSP